MKTARNYLVIAAAFAATLAWTAPAAAGSAFINLRPGQSESLDRCKGDAGKVEVRRSGKQINVVFKKVACAKLDVFRTSDSEQVHKTYKLSGKTMPRSASFTMPKAVIKGASSIKLRLRSNSGKHADYLYIDLKEPRAELDLGSSTTMPACGGTVEITHAHDGKNPQVNVVMKNVTRCQTLTVESNNGRAIGKTYKIGGGKRGKRSASFTMSWKKVIDKGRWGFKKNNIHIKVSGKGQVEDRFAVGFVATGR